MIKTLHYLPVLCLSVLPLHLSPSLSLFHLIPNSDEDPHWMKKITQDGAAPLSTTWLYYSQCVRVINFLPSNRFVAIRANLRRCYRIFGAERWKNEMNGILEHDSTLWGYTGPGEPWVMRWNKMIGVLGHDSDICKAILGRGQPGLMRWILLWIMPLAPDRSFDLVTSNPARYQCATDASDERKREK